MDVILLGFLFVIVIPLAEGALTALALRELYVRHPLPLGGVIVPQWWNPPMPKAKTTEPAKDQEKPEESAEAVDNAESPKVQTTQEASSSEDTPIADPIAEQGAPTPSGVSVFDGTHNIPEGLAVNNVLNAMTTAMPAVNVDNLERIIDEAAQTETKIPEAVHAIVEDMNLDDLQALAEALPGTKIDLTQELETHPPDSLPGLSMAKDVLGENFDFDALEKQAQQTKESLKLYATADLTEISLDIREDESGTVQVSSPFVANTLPQLADFVMPQTILSYFSDDWIQESNGMAEVSEGDPGKFCFTEESLPMFMRKKRKQG